MILRGVIMIRARAAVGRLDAEIIAQKVPGDEVVESAFAAAVVKARLDCAMAAAVNRHRAARIDDSAFGFQVDDAGGAQAVLRRQCAGNESHRGNESGIERLTEYTDALRQD